MENSSNWRWIKATFVLIGLLGALPALAFDNCQRIIEREFVFPGGQTGTLVEEMGWRVTYDVPADALAVAETVKILRDPGMEFGFFPVAVTSIEDGRLILVPDLFVEVSCRFAMSYYLYNDQGRTLTAGLTRAGPEARRCRETGNDFKTCIEQFSKTLETYDQGAFAAMPEDKRDTASRFFTDAIYQVMAHEMAHQIFDHNAKIAVGALTRQDAEFEADFHAITGAMQVGRATHAIAYIFDVMDYFYNQGGYRSAPEYETLACRSANGVDVMTSIGIGLLFLDRVAMGQRTGAAASRDSLRKAQRDSAALYDPQNDGCGRLKTRMLSEAHSEANEIIGFMIDNFEAFAPAGEQVATQRPSIAYAGLQLVDAYEKLLDDSQHLRLLVTDSLSLYLQRLTQANGFSMTDREKARLLTHVRGSASSRSYGRVLASFNYQSVEAMEDQATRQGARAALEEAVRFNPALTEAWSQLGMIAIFDKDCETAIGHFVHAYYTAQREEMQNQMAGIAQGVNGWIEAGDARCAS